MILKAITKEIEKVKELLKEDDKGGKMIEKYYELEKKSRDFVIKWDGKVCEDNLNDFINESVKLDKFRFETSYEWYEPKTYEYVRKYIIENPNPDKGLLLFFLCCWLDMQMNYKIVWSTFLEEAAGWIEDPVESKRPRGSFIHTAPNIEKTLSVVVRDKSISDWFIKTVNRIIKENGKRKGNLYGFVGHIMTELLTPSESLKTKIYWLTSGSVALIGNWKRVWMLLMFLRRDKNIVKKLLTRALEDKKHGKKAIDYWYDQYYFNENESELPVDKRIKDWWPRLWGKGELSEKSVGYKAHEIAKRYKIPPSTFDAIFFGV